MIEVEGINVTITGDTRRLEEAARRATTTINSMSHNVNNNARNIRDAFDRIGTAAARFRDMLEQKGIEATPANLRIIKQAYKEIEEEAKAAAAAAKKLAQEQKEIQANANKATLRDAKAERRKEMQDQADYDRRRAEYEKQRDRTAQKNYEERFRKAKQAKTTQNKGEQAASNAEMKRRRKAAVKAAADKKTMEDNARKYTKRDEMAEDRFWKKRIKRSHQMTTHRLREAEKRRKEQERAAEKARREAQARATNLANQKAAIVNKAALYGGLGSGVFVGGRFGFASGFFGGRIGANLGGMVGGVPGSAVGGVLGSIGGAALAAGAKAMQLYLQACVALMSKLKDMAVDFLTSSVKAGLEFEKQSTTFRVLTGSKEKGDALYKSIEKITINSPYKTSQLAKQAEVLLGSGVAPEQIPAFIGRIGDMAGGNMERFHYIAKAFADVNAVGHLRGQELNQFSNQGIGRKDFAAALGMSVPQFERKMAKGEITSDLVYQAGNALTDKGGRFHGLGKEISTTTVGGALESLEETIESAKKRFGEMILKKFNIAEIINKVINSMGDLDMSGVEAWLERAKQAFTPLGAVVIRFVDYVATSTVRLAQSLPSWEEFASVVSDSVDRYLPPLIELFKGLGIVTLALGRIMLQVTGFMIKAINSVTGSAVFKKVIGDVPLLPEIARQGTLDKWMADMQKGIRGLGDPTNMITHPGKGVFAEQMKAGAPLFGPLGKVFFENKIPAIREGIEDFGKMFGKTPFFNKQIMDLVEKLDKQSIEGTHPFEKFEKGMKKLNRARFTDGIEKPLIDDKTYNIGVMDFVKGLQHDMKDFMDHQPTTAYGGSSEAQGIINANITMQTNNIQERILMVIEASKIVQEQQLEQEKLIVDAVKKSFGLNENGL